MRPAILLLTLLLSPMAVLSQIIDLRGQWKFHINDKPGWANPQFDDSSWENIFTPSAWEDEGFHGYDGFAWYRTTFDGRKLDKNEIYYLGLGYIDDSDEVFVNGVLIGFSGSMPPKFKTAYNTERKYPLPSEVINFSGPNTIAIRVFDATLSGGVIDGRLGIYRSEKNKYLAVDLSGLWSFAPSRRGERITTESEWRKIMVPGAWEFQGNTKYDGFAWYKRTFILPDNMFGQPLILLLGKIDDFDKTYINGVLVGSTNDERSYGRSESYSKLRAYQIPPSLIKKGSNLIEVFVEDMGNLGGIYEGTVGITTRQNYLRYFDR